MGQGLNARDPQARHLLRANTGVLRRAQPAAPYGTPRHRSTSQATGAWAQPPETALRHRCAHHRSRKTRHDTAHGRPGSQRAEPTGRRTQARAPRHHNQPPDPLTAIVSGEAGTWHPGHALYCLWWWAQRRWPHSRDWTATWRFSLDGRQQLEAIPQRQRTAETPTATNLFPVFAIHLIRALAMGGQLQPGIRTETEAQAAHAALVHEILSALHSALVRRVGNPPGP